MSKGEKRPTWFKLFLHQKPIIDSVPDDVVGRAVKAAFHYDGVILHAPSGDIYMV